MQIQKRVLIVFLVVLSILLNGEIRISSPIRLTLKDNCSKFPSIWDKGGERVIYAKTCEEGDKITTSCIVVMNPENFQRREYLKDTTGRYNDVFLSPDGNYLLARWVSNRNYGPSDWVVINIETGEAKRYAYVRGNRFVHPDTTLFWDLRTGHEVKWIPKKEYRPLRDSLLREQKHHWPEWVKELIKEGAKRVIEYRKQIQKKVGVKEIKLTKSPRVPGHFFVKILKRDDKGYVEKAQLWAYPKGGEPYLAMDENIYGIIRCFSPNHKYMIIVGKDNNLYIAHVDGSDVTKVTDIPGKFYFSILWAPDSKKFMYDVSIEGEKGINIWLVKIEE